MESRHERLRKLQLEKKNMLIFSLNSRKKNSCHFKKQNNEVNKIMPVARLSSIVPSPKITSKRTFLGHRFGYHLHRHPMKSPILSGIKRRNHQIQWSTSNYPHFLVANEKNVMLQRPTPSLYLRLAVRLPPAFANGTWSPDFCRWSKNGGWSSEGANGANGFETRAKCDFVSDFEWRFGGQIKKTQKICLKKIYAYIIYI